MIHRFCEGLGIARMGAKGAQQKFFEYLLHGFTEPDEILGVVDLHELKENKRFTRIRDGSITEADLIFLDEAFRGNSAILNSLLTIINERRVYEAGEIVRAKARVIFGASNDTPTPRQLEELGAFYSRFIIRLHSPHTAMEFVADGPSEERVELLRRGWKNEVRELRGGYDPARVAIPPISCLNDILFLNRLMTESWGSEDLGGVSIRPFVDLYHRLAIALGRYDPPVCSMDDRKFIRLFSVARAHAIFTRNEPPAIQDLCVLHHIWDDLLNAVKVREVVQAFIRNPQSSV